MKKTLLFLMFPFLYGCTGAQMTTAKADAHALATGALGLIRAAQDHPELLAEARDATVLLVTKVDPKDAPNVVGALGHVDAGNLDRAAAFLAPVVAATAAVGSAK